MKKITALLLFLTMIVSLSACGKGEYSPSLGMSEELYNVGKKTVNVIDEYIDLEISEDEFKEKLDRLYSQSESISDNNEDDYVEGLCIQANITSAKLNANKGEYSELLEARNDLAELLNMETK